MSGMNLAGGTGGLVGINRFMGQQGQAGMMEAAGLQDKREMAKLQADAAEQATQMQAMGSLAGSAMMLAAMALI